MAVGVLPAVTSPLWQVFCHQGTRPAPKARPGGLNRGLPMNDPVIWRVPMATGAQSRWVFVNGNVPSEDHDLKGCLCCGALAWLMPSESICTHCEKEEVHSVH